MSSPAIEKAATLSEQVLAALKARHWARASELATALRDAAPDSDKGWWLLGLALRQQSNYEAADALFVEALGKFPGSIHLADGYAWVAASRRDWVEALARWESAAARFPRHPMSCTGVALALRELGRLAEADQVLSHGFVKFPAHRAIAEGYAASAEKLGNLDEAVRRYEQLRERYPDDPKTHLAVCRALRLAKRGAEAESALAGSLQCFPGSASEFLTASAEWEAARGDWRRAAEQWRRVAEVAPDSVQALVGFGRALRLQRKYEEADAHSTTAINRFPDDSRVWLEYAATAAARRDWPQAKDRWSKVFRRFPEIPSVWIGYAEMLVMIGDRQAAEAVAMEASKKFPSDSSVAVVHARMATSSLGADDEIKIWEALAAKFPGNAVVERELRVASFRSQLQNTETSLSSAIKAGAGSALESRPQQLTDAEVMASFESLGENCEFGLAQRRAGIEPLGLLRFAGMQTKILIDLLNANLEGVGNPEFTTLREEKGEYVINDTRYGMPFHTFIGVRQQSYDSVYKMMTTKLQYLRRKLLEDLEECQKIFVVADVMLISDVNRQRLEAALMRHGPARLLFVKLAEPGHEAGTLVRNSAMTLTGYIEKSPTHVRGPWNAAVADWISICRAALTEFARPVTHAAPTPEPSRSSIFIAMNQGVV